MNKVKHFLPETAMYQLYCTLILPYLHYGILLWGSAYKKHVDKILKIQKRAIRIISNSSYLCHTKPLFEKYETLDIYDIYKKELCIFMYKYHNGLLPSAFDLLFTNLGSSHSYNTRNAENYHFEIHKIRNAISDGLKYGTVYQMNFKNVNS